MSFFRNLKNSVYNPGFYKAEQHAPFKQALGYYTKLALFAALLTAIIVSIIVIPTITFFTSSTFVNKIVGYYPEELTLSVKNGQASSNVQEPYSIPFPSDLGSSHNRPKHKNLIVIDTKTPFSLESFEKADTMALVTKDYIIGEKGNGQLTLQKLKTLPDVAINRSKILSWIEFIRPWIKFIIPGIIVATFILSFIARWILGLLASLVLSFLVWIVQMIRKVRTPFAEVYKLTLYAITLPLLLDTVLFVIGGLPWYLYLVIYLVVFFANNKSESAGA